MKKIILFLSLFLITATAFSQAATSTDDYALTFFKKLNERQTKLTYMNKKGSLAKVGTETIKGNISGTVFYDVKIKGAGAVVTLRYTNYCDEAGWVFDGEIITNSNNALADLIEGLKLSFDGDERQNFETSIKNKIGKTGKGLVKQIINELKSSCENISCIRNEKGFFAAFASIRSCK